MKRFSLVTALLFFISFAAFGDIDEFFSETRTTKSQYQKCYAWFNAQNFFYSGIFFRDWGEVVDGSTSDGTGNRFIVTSELVNFCKPFLGPYRLTWTAPLLEDVPVVEGGSNTAGSSSNTPSSLKEKLLELKTLVDEGLITEEDYEQAKKQMIDNM